MAMTGLGSNDRGGVSPFGAEQPPVLDPRSVGHVDFVKVHRLGLGG